MKWDLSDLYKSITDPKIARDEKKIQEDVEVFRKTFQSKIESEKLSAKTLLEALKHYEDIEERIHKIWNFAYLIHSTDTKSVEVGKFFQKTEEFTTNSGASLLWFPTKLAEHDIAALKKLAADAALTNYKYYLQKIINKKPFMLPTRESEILAKKDQSAKNAFVRFYDEKESRTVYELPVEGSLRVLNTSEITVIARNHPDRELRKEASNKISETHARDEHFYTYVLNTLLLDKKVEDEIRGYQYPEQETYLSYDVTPEIVNTMIKTVTGAYALPERYYRAKAKLLGLKKLHEWDRYSPITPKSEKYTWAKAKKTVLEAFGGFDSSFAAIAEEIMAKNWVDAKTTANRRSGAFCNYVTPSLHPYVFMNFSGDINSVTTLAHELGHAVHGYLARVNSFVNFMPSTATAEIASIFAENIIIDHLLENSQDPEIKLNLLAEHIQNIFATVFRQSAFHLFEKDIHTHRRQKGELSAKEFDNYYQTRLQESFGRGLTVTPAHAKNWMPILHFYHYNFYVFTYAFGQLLALSLFETYKKHDDFAREYLELLENGGSKSPSALLSAVAQDISDKRFWSRGIKTIEGYIENFEKLSGAR